MARNPCIDCGTCVGWCDCFRPRSWDEGDCGGCCDCGGVCAGHIAGGPSYGPLRELLECARAGTAPPLRWAVEWSRGGEIDPLAGAWAAPNDAGAMLDVLNLLDRAERSAGYEGLVFRGGPRTDRAERALIGALGGNGHDVVRATVPAPTMGEFLAAVAEARRREAWMWP